MLKCMQFCRWMKHLDTGVPTGTSLNRMYKNNFLLVLLQIFIVSKYNSPAQCWKWKLGIRGNYYCQQYDWWECHYSAVSEHPSHQLRSAHWCGRRITGLFGDTVGRVKSLPVYIQLFLRPWHSSNTSFDTLSHVQKEKLIERIFGNKNYTVAADELCMI